MVSNFYADFGFQKAGESADGCVEWILPVDQYERREVFIRPVRIDGPFPGETDNAERNKSGTGRSETEVDNGLQEHVFSTRA
jgi:hypothetical protein